MNRVILRQTLPRLLVCLVAVQNGCAQLPTQTSLNRPSAYGSLYDDSVQMIVVDAGHGGHDPGATYAGVREKDLALDIARRVRDRLRIQGFKVTMTRDSDRFVELSRRAKIGNDLRADLFVSVHLNANTNPQVSGAEVYFPKESVISSTGPWPPSIIGSEVSDHSGTVKQILWDMVLSKTRSESRSASSEVCRAITGKVNVPCKVKPARFVVLRESRMPSMLVEVGYLSNRSEAQLLQSSSYRQSLSEAIVDGIMRYGESIRSEHL